MNDPTIAIVRESFDLIEPIAPQAGAMFYAHLFAADPSLHALFTHDIGVQGDKLMQLIGTAVLHLDEPDVLMPVLDELGRRHAGFGVRDAHYDTAGAALLRTLHQALGVAYNAEVEEAWVDVYGVIAARMKSAAALAPVTA
jgi:hemoglobin-like flavoprotein